MQTGLLYWLLLLLLLLLGRPLLLESEYFESSYAVFLVA